MSTLLSTPVVTQRPLTQSNEVEAAQELAPRSRIDTWHLRRLVSLVVLVFLEK
jgi:hypothetical protein